VPGPVKKDRSAAGCKVKVTKNGPYVVSGGVPLSERIIEEDADGECHGWREGMKYAAGESYALCRCGHSRTPPFCDGTHARIGFDGAEVASHTLYREKAIETAGPGLRLTDAADICAEARFCHRAGTIWNLVQDSDEAVSRQTAIEEGIDCPSGRLVVWDQDGESIEPVLEPSIGVVNDAPAGKRGPLWVRGGIPIEAADGTAYERRNRVTLCRCGRSANQPFCDGSHLK
jgi:CDGSH-type Zn-finger protein